MKLTEAIRNAINDPEISHALCLNLNGAPFKEQLHVMLPDGTQKYLISTVLGTVKTFDPPRQWSAEHLVKHLKIRKENLPKLFREV